MWAEDFVPKLVETGVASDIGQEQETSFFFVLQQEPWGSLYWGDFCLYDGLIIGHVITFWFWLMVLVDSGCGKNADWLGQ